jgi:hypothetical protein
LRFTRNGHTHDYCGRTHAIKAKERRIIPSLDPTVEVTFSGLDWEIRLLHRKNEQYGTVNGFNIDFSSKRSSFLRYGRGLYFSDVSGKSNDYSDGKVIGDKEVRVMFMCYVALGKEFTTTDTKLEGCPPGYDSVNRLVSPNGLNFGERVVYDNASPVPRFMIVYTVE